MVTTLRYAANEFAAAEHGGTHLDAPYHFYKEGLHVGELPLKNLIVPRKYVHGARLEPQ